ncbi:MAG: PCRF domain-containing protein [Alphaproteobacteria bacterium]|nr:PCRF domain-containing protein [Alphaproteobacteria bacterium]
MSDDRLKELESLMASPLFWENSEEAKRIVNEYQSLKNPESAQTISAVELSIIAGAGGVDAEDWASMLYDMYRKYIEKKKWLYEIHDIAQNEHKGYRHISITITHKDAYNNLMHESGVHRLVRNSPFNAKGLRQTSFALVDVVPQLSPMGNIQLTEADYNMQFTNSGGPGGQNVNKRETAVQLTHIHTGISVRVESERSQAQNKERALAILRGKLYAQMEKEHKQKVSELSTTSGKKIEWGSQIRNYILHPYQLVKDTRSKYETHNAENFLDGNIDDCIQSLQSQ